MKSQKIDVCSNNTVFLFKKITPKFYEALHIRNHCEKKCSIKSQILIELKIWVQNWKSECKNMNKKEIILFRRNLQKMV